MKHCYVEDLGRCVGKEVTIKGWLHNRRSSGKVQFLLIRDGSGIVQCVAAQGEFPEELYSRIEHLPLESSITVTGKVRQDKRAPGGYELALTSAQVIAEAQEYPITKKEHGVGFLMQYRHLWLRGRKQHALLKIRSTLVKAIYDFFFSRGYVLIDTPILTPAACEGTTTLFNVDYFGDKAFLTQSGQLYLEAAAASFGRVFCFGPTFRAEKSKTRRHLTEFWMVEPEVAFIELDGLLELAENFVYFITARVLQNNRSELETLGADLDALEKIKPPFYRLTYTDAVDILTGEKAKKFLTDQLEEFKNQKKQIENRIAELEQEQKGKIKQWKRDKNAAELIDLRSELSEVETKIENNPKHAKLAAEFVWGKDLGGSDETIISQMHDKPVFVTHYPGEAKAFYMKTDRTNDRVVLNFDLLAPAGFGEIIGGSVREDDYNFLAKRITEFGLNIEDYSWYLDLRKYGSVPHGGFGLGVERTVAWLTGERHIRQCIPFPRMMDKVYI